MLDVIKFRYFVGFHFRMESFPKIQRIGKIIIAISRGFLLMSITESD